ncbi:MAG: AgmX/PglI C-terminal domain-containing protein [Proteobacteria bacterium]|nr:AgmX/PglI C-terminal domain-containing protein [Pseudomonadota bacterium]
MAGAKVPLTFRIFKGDQLLREERLTLSVIKLGKVPSAHLKLDDETVSRMHAIIEVDGANNVSIIDLGSTKGTFVNGQKVNKAKLQSGDTIVVGETRIELAIGVGEEENEEPTRVNTAAAPAAPAMSDASASRPMGAPAIPMAAAAPPPPPARLGSGPVPSVPAAPPAFAPPPAPASFGGGFAPSAPAPMAATMASTAPALRPPPGMASAPIFGTAMAPPVGFQQSMAESVDEIGGARAVEVAAMLGDSVVGVKHCINPRGGRVSGMSYALFLVGFFTLVLSIFAFGKSVALAAENKGRYDYETIVRKKPGYSVRPLTMSAGYDWMELGGFVMSLVTLTYGIARVRREKEDPNCRIGLVPDDPYKVPGTMAFAVIPGMVQGLRKFFGRERRVDFAIEGAPSPEHPLVSANGDDFMLNLWPGCEAEMVQGGQTTSLSPGSQPIPQGAKIRVKTGKTTFLVSAVPQPRRYANPLFSAIEMAVVLCFAGSLVFHLGFVALLSFVPVEDSSTNIDLASLEDTSVKSSSSIQDDPNPEKEEEKPDTGEAESGGTGQSMALDEGKMGKKESERAEGQFKMQKNSEEAQLARAQAMEEARNAGILGETSAITKGGAFASLTGTGDISSGFDDSNVYGGLLGNEAGEMNGGFGYGRSGFGPGGGGTGWGTIGTGRYGTIGHGNGTGTGYGAGGGRGGFRGRTAAVPTVTVGTPRAEGDLDKAIIRRYIKRNIQKIQYCYEKALLANGELSGTVMVQFFISPNGAVATSSGRGVNAETASCVAGVIKEIEFPKPKGGGGVQVNYPFDFRRSGG